MADAIRTKGMTSEQHLYLLGSLSPTEAHWNAFGYFYTLQLISILFNFLIFNLVNLDKNLCILLKVFNDFLGYLLFQRHFRKIFTGMDDRFQCKI